MRWRRVAGLGAAVLTQAISNDPAKVPAGRNAGREDLQPTLGEDAAGALTLQVRPQRARSGIQKAVSTIQSTGSESPARSLPRLGRALRTRFPGAGIATANRGHQKLCGPIFDAESKIDHAGRSNVRYPCLLVAVLFAAAGCHHSPTEPTPDLSGAFTLTKTDPAPAARPRHPSPSSSSSRAARSHSCSPTPVP